MSFLDQGVLYLSNTLRCSSLNCIDFQAGLPDRIAQLITFMMELFLEACI
jgi:hypothetical protein